MDECVQCRTNRTIDMNVIKIKFQMKIKNNVFVMKALSNGARTNTNENELLLTLSLSLCVCESV